MTAPGIDSKTEAFEAIQSISTSFPIAVYGSPMLYLAKLLTNLIVPMIFIAVLITIIGRLRQTGIDLANSDCVLRMKLCCLMFMGCLVNIPTAATYIAWNDHQVSDSFMAFLLTAGAIADVLRLPFVLGFIFIGFQMRTAILSSPTMGLVRSVLNRFGFHVMAARLTIVPCDKVIVLPGRGNGKGLEDGGIVRIPSVAIPVLFWLTLLAITITIAKLYRIS